MMKKNIVLSSFAILFSSMSFASDFKDTLFSKQWGLQNTGQTILRATSPHDRERVEGTAGADINWVSLATKEIPKDREIIVAVLDSGIDLNHPDLKDRLWFNKAQCENFNEEERKANPCYGWNFLDNNGDLDDKIGHGTHVSGIIAANHNKIGIAGVAHPQIKIMPLKVLSPEVTSFVYKQKIITDIIANAIGFAIKNGADVINLSLGWPKAIETPKIQKAIKEALAANVPIIAASGNNNKDVVTFPCTNKGVICVGAVDNQGKIAEFSNFGGKVDILAPGEFIVSTYPLNVESRTLRISSYEAKKGTSQAAPFISAIAASIKLLDPEISLDKLTAKLYNSSKALSEDEPKLSTFGLVDMKKALFEEPETFIIPDFKNVLNVTYDAKRLSFAFRVPVKNYGEKVEKLKVTFSSNLSGIKISEPIHEFEEIEAGDTKHIIVEGEILDPSIDNTAELTVEIQAGENYKIKKSTAIVFAKDLSRDQSVKINPIKGVNPAHISFFRGRRKFARMGLVSDKYNLNANPEYYYINRSKQTEEHSVISLLRVGEKESTSVDLKFAKQGQLLGVMRADINMDGKADYFLYNMGKNEENLVFTFFDHEFNPLFGEKSQWFFPITAFEGLPFENGKEKFYWIKKKTKEFGNVLLPAFPKNWFMPDADNTWDLLDRIPAIQSQHLYYLNPIQKEGKTEVEVRAMDSFSFLEKIERKLRLRVPRETFSLQRPFFQSKEDAQNGVVKTLLSVGREFQKRYFMIEFNEASDWKMKPFFGTQSFLENNNMFPILDLEDQLNQTSDANFMVTLNRVTARISQVSSTGGETFQATLKNDSWGDVFFTHTASFAGEHGTTFLESRFSVISVLKNGKVERLPINRDSSFPGMDFSETLAPVSVSVADGSKRAALYINSTLIFGDRLYTMAQTDKGFVRPLGLSVNVPKNCIHLDPTRLGENGDFHYTMLCRERNNQMSMRFFPLKI